MRAKQLAFAVLLTTFGRGTGAGENHSETSTTAPARSQRVLSGESAAAMAAECAESAVLKAAINPEQ